MRLRMGVTIWLSVILVVIAQSSNARIRMSDNLDAVLALRSSKQTRLSVTELMINGPTRVPDPSLTRILSATEQRANSRRSFRTMRMLAALYLANGQPDRALAALDTQANPDELSAYFRSLACVWQRQECRPEPQLAAVLRKAALAFWGNEKYADSYAGLLLAERLDPGVRPDKAAVYRLLSFGAGLVQQDRMQAIYWATLWSQSAPGNIAAYFALCQNYLDTGQLSMAVDILNVADRYGARGDWQFGSLMGQTLWAQGQREQAIESYRASIALNPQNPTTAWYLGFALVTVGRNDEALPYLVFVATRDRSQPYLRHLAEAADMQLSRLYR